jgi:hypothetical protein
MLNYELPISLSLRLLALLSLTAFPNISRPSHHLHFVECLQIYLTYAVQDASFFGVFMALYHVILYSSFGSFVGYCCHLSMSAVFPFHFSRRINLVLVPSVPTWESTQFLSGFVCWRQAWGVLVCPWSIERKLT